ncbi:hypothetical protein XENOCAPTIV_012752, partial [Xenoophorus captivus]
KKKKKKKKFVNRQYNKEKEGEKKEEQEEEEEEEKEPVGGSGGLFFGSRWSVLCDGLMDGVCDRYQRVCLSETQLDFPGQPYSVSVLKVGYCIPHTDGTFKADGTITLIEGIRNILVDTGGPWDREFLLQSLKQRGLEPRDITLVVGTHGHSDHIGNLNLFPSALTIVGYDVSEGDVYLSNQLAEGQAYTVDEHVRIS